jgi:hypothetical protein
MTTHQTTASYLYHAIRAHSTAASWAWGRGDTRTVHYCESAITVFNTMWDAPLQDLFPSDAY